jgi:shikimate kinase
MEVIIITGACGVGKSTIARAWAKAKQGAIIECDYFTEWIFKSNFPHWTVEEEQFVAALTGTVAHEYLRHQMPVAIENVWSPSGIQILLDRLKEQALVSSIKVIWLVCDRNENHRRDQLRKPEDQMQERVDIVNKELSNYRWPEYVQKVDSTRLSIEETVAVIERLDGIRN